MSNEELLKFLNEKMDNTLDKLKTISILDNEYIKLNAYYQAYSEIKYLILGEKKK